jgi:hypothetical protein
MVNATMEEQVDMTTVNHATHAKAPARPAASSREAGTAETVGAERPTSRFGEAVEIDLSEAAAQAAKPGRSAASPAHQARAFLAERTGEDGSEDGEKVPFGQIVSRIARGLDPAGAFAAPVLDETDAPAGDETAPDGGEAVELVPDEAADDTAIVPESDGETADLLTALLEDDEDSEG